MAICLGAFTAANAQYTPEKGDFSVEFGFTPFNTTNGESFKLNNDFMLKGRYFLNEKNALRLKLGLGIDNKTVTQTATVPAPANATSAYTTSETTTETKDKQTNFGFMLGYERHLVAKGRLDVYVGLELGYELNKFSGTETVEGTSKDFDAKGVQQGYGIQEDVTDYTNMNTAGTQSQNAFAANLFAGADFYVYKGLYLGAELVMNFRTGKSPNSYKSWAKSSIAYKQDGTPASVKADVYDGETGVQVITTGGNGTSSVTTVNGKVNDNETTTTSFKFFVEPAIRIGWTF